jgi:hypothetical protein
MLVKLAPGRHLPQVAIAILNVVTGAFLKLDLDGKRYHLLEYFINTGGPRYMRSFYLRIRIYAI